MARKIPTDAFMYYFSMGASRSYQAVADHFHVSKRAVVTLATKEKGARMAEIYLEQLQADLRALRAVPIR